MKKTIIAMVLAAVAIPATPSFAKPHDHGRPGYGREYDRNGRYREPRRLSRDDHVWRGRDGRYYCRRNNGTTGLIIGAGAGALLGRTIDTDGDRTVGTLLGGVGGALLGREIDRGGMRCR